MPGFDFVPFSTRYEPKNALALAKAAQLAYRSDSTVRNQLSDWGFAETYVFDRDDAQGFVATNDDIIIVAFRGTELLHLQDLMTDVNLWLIPSGSGDVHSGFKRALDVVWEEVWTKIEEFQGRTLNGTMINGLGKSLWFTGHSLGGALATLAVAKLRLELDRGVFGLYTFGSPRTGSREFADAFNTVFKPYTFRFVNNNDFVARIPLRLMNYSHVGTLKYFDNEGNLHNDIGWWWRFLDQVQGRIEDFLKPGTDGLNDHNIEIYINALENQI